MKTISATETLAPGTQIQVGNHRGIVISVSVVQAVPCGTIAVHKVKMTERFHRGFGTRGKWVACEPFVKKVNYSHLSVILAA